MDARDGEGATTVERPERNRYEITDGREQNGRVEGRVGCGFAVTGGGDPEIQCELPGLG